MLEPITKQELIDASADALALEQVVNGTDTEDVTSRLARTYPTLAKALRLIVENGLLGATPFNLGSQMIASSLVDGDYAVVTDDPNPEINGFYQRQSGLWEFLAWNPLNQAKAYADANPMFRPSVLAAAADFNTLTAEGRTVVPTDEIAAACTNRPSQTAGVLDVALVGVVVLQVYRVAQFDLAYERQRLSNGTWTAWVQSASKDMVDTTAANTLQSAQGYADANAVFKPTVNPTEKNINNSVYGVSYYTVAADITLANNFPIASEPSYVLTYAVTGSSVKYQRVVLPFANPVRIFDRSFTGTWSSWSEGTNKAALDALTTVVNNNHANAQAVESKVFSVAGKNKLDKSKIVDGEYVSPSAGKITASASYKRSGFIPVTAGLSYYLSGTSATDIGWFAAADKTSTAISVSTNRVGVAPVGANYAVVNVSNDGTANYNDTAQFEIGTSATAYEAYKVYIDIASVFGADNFLTRTEILYNDSFNKIDLTKVDYAKRYSTGALALTPDDLGIAATAHIAVAEGEWYTVSGTGIFGLPAAGNCQGGYFTSAVATTAVQNIAFVAPVTGGGAAFKVPTGLGITHVVISLRKLNDQAASTTLHGDVQLELGELSTAYQVYAAVPKIKTELLPKQSSGGTSMAFDDRAWYKYTAADGAKIHQDKLPNFRKHMLLKDKDLVVVMTGTSLTARTSEHCTLRADASTRPPMMHSNAFCSHIWDAMKWAGQQYRRYDAASFFTETGAFLTSSNLAEWDDGSYRDGLTRYSDDAAASVAFTVPVNAWQFNFIYRTDSLGCTAKVVVAEGNGQLQVFDEATSTWVEANNYTFSQLEATPVTRSITVPNPVTATTSTITAASKSNTTYQKRLKMRSKDNVSLDSLASAKTVTVSNNSGSGRFMYWGVEYSPRQFMLTYINSSRGSFSTSAVATNGLPKVQDNEVWSFKPDLILSELAIHNDGAGNASVYAVGTWQGLAYNYVNNLDFELSLYSRAAFFGQSTEYAFFVGSITYGFTGINEDGTLKFGMQTASVKGAARAMTALDKYQEALSYLKDQNIVTIDTAKRWVDAGNAIFGDLRAATIASGKDGSTFTNEGSHWNDTGAKIMAKAVIPII